MKEYKNTTKTKMNLFSRIADSIYQQGYEDGQAATPFTDTEEAEKKAYNRGLNEAWETAKKIVNMSEDEFDAVFDDVEYLEAAFESTPQETIAKIKAYEDKQKQDAEIKVGDEVTHNGAKFIVLNIDSQTSVYCLDIRGRTPIFASIRNLTKTGRHFDQIAEVLAELRGAEQ